MPELKLLFLPMTVALIAAVGCKLLACVLMVRASGLPSR